MSTRAVREVSRPSRTVMLRSLLEVPGTPVSLDAPVLGEDMKVADLLEDKQTAPPDASLLRADMVSQVERAIARLSDRERHVLRLRLGMGTDHALTLDEAGVRLSVTRERIRQIETRALEKLRVRWGARRLRNFVEAS